jgi:glyoxylase-like metal-dependent hydrolase (beta-lactamase superfamily II)
MTEAVRAFDEIAPGVFLTGQAIADGKIGVVLGDDAAVAIDAGLHPEEGAALAGFIRSRGRRPDRLIYTHFHNDHVFGSTAFRGAEVIAQAAWTGAKERQRQKWAEANHSTPEAADLAIAWPTRTFIDEMVLDIGGTRFRLLHAPGHSPDSACVYVERERVLFCGDTVMTGILPAFGDGDSRVLERTLRSLLATPAEILVSGHGAPLVGAPAIRDWLEVSIAYLAGLREVIVDGIADGLEDEAIAALLPYERHVPPRLDRSRHGMDTRHRRCIDAMIAEERKARP